MSAPERIWLQDAGNYDHAAQFEVTWCAEPQDDVDAEYIRADLVRALVEALRWYEAQARRSKELVVWGLDDNRPSERRSFEALRRDGGTKAASALRAIEGAKP